MTGTPAGSEPPSQPAGMLDYERECAEFSWPRAAAQLAGLPGGGLNIAYETVDRHAEGPSADAVALRLLRRTGEPVQITYAELRRQTARFAGLLKQLGVERGERVFSLAGRIPELYVTALGTMRHGAVFCPLFSAFGPDPIEQRLRLGDARVLVTTPSLYRRKVQGLLPRLPRLRHVLLVGEHSDIARIPTAKDFRELLDAASEQRVAATQPEDMALLHFTSGTTGTPKGAIHVHEAVLSHRETGRMALDLHAGDVFWCTADPGWVTGTSYGMIAPLALGATCVVDEVDFDADRWYQLIEDHHVEVWYTSPTALRMLMRIGAHVAHEYDLSSLRFIASVGEPLSADAVQWGQSAFGLQVHDNWWQTETGGIMVANYRTMAVRPGSMGRPLPGVEAAIAKRDDEGGPVLAADGTLALVEDPEQQGELVLRPGWPSMFRGYLGNRERYESCFAGGWYLSGDLVRRDAEGYLWFVGRGDDVIKSAGHLIGPFEVESALLEHPAVADAAVIGMPDPLAGEVVKAFVSPTADVTIDQALTGELLGFARQRLGASIAPREIEFIDSIPHNRSGKVMRRLLRSRELGLPEGDTSTLEASR